MTLYRDAWKWRVATSEAGLELGAFPQVGLPPVDVPSLQEFTEVVERADGSEVGHGYLTWTGFWETMDGRQYHALRRRVDIARASAGQVLFMTVDRGNGRKSFGDWVDISGKPNAPRTTSGEPNDQVSVYENVTLTLNAVTVINDPSSYSDP